MTPFGRLKSWLGLTSPKASQPTTTGRAIRARYDNAQSNDGNKRLWALTDFLSAKSANSLQVRKTLRTRSRYEIANSSYLRGIVNTSVDDLIGTGPTLQVTTPDSEANRRIEAAYGQWCEAVGLTEKLRTIGKAKRGDGEGFLFLRNNPATDSPVQLYPQEIECDQVSTPNPQFDGRQWVDGLVLDPLGNPAAYHLLRQHPGDLYLTTLNPADFDTIPARYVIHWFRKDRPGQVRGVPEITPSLELFGELRRYRRAVLGAAETAASIAAYLKTPAPALGADDDDVGDGNDPFKTLEIERDLMMMLPAGTDIAQLDAKQPTTTFDSFHDKLLGEACRAIGFPLNLALGSSQNFNFSSARLDWIKYHAGLEIERGQCECVVLDPLFRAWLEEAVMVPGLLPDGTDIANLAYEWHWPGFPYMDPLVDAQADTERLQTNKTLSYARYFSRRGLDWQDEFAQLAAEKKLMDSLGLTPADVTPQGPPTSGAKQPQAASAA